jgi:hypothetical protein
MGRNNYSIALLGTTFLVLVGGLWFFDHDVEPVEVGAEEVREIYSKPQLYDGEIVENLTSLGHSGIPAMIEVFSDGVEFPIVFVDSFAAIGDARATRSILDYLDSLDLGKDSEDTAVANRAIWAIEKIGDSTATPALSKIFAYEPNHPLIRLSAAATVASIDSGERSLEARNVVLNYYETRNDYYLSMGKGFEESDMIRALIALDDQESTAILREFLTLNPAPGLAIPIINHIAENYHPENQEILRKLAFTNLSEYPVIQFEALVSSLPQSNERPSKEVIAKLKEFAKLTPNSVEYSEQISARAISILESIDSKNK